MCKVYKFKKNSTIFRNMEIKPEEKKVESGSL